MNFKNIKYLTVLTVSLFLMSCSDNDDETMITVTESEFAGVYKVKDQMGTDNIQQRETELTQILMSGVNNIDGVEVLEKDVTERLCIVSFYVPNLHYNLIVRLLNDKFGVQSRGGCSCAGTYGHILLNVDKDMSGSITNKIDNIWVLRRVIIDNRNCSISSSGSRRCKINF